MVRVTYQELNTSQKREQAVHLIRQQRGLVVYPTDTLYGVGGDFFSTTAINQIDRLKGRKDRPYSLIVPDIHAISELVDRVPPIFEEIYERYLPGKYTFLFKAASDIDRRLLKGSEKIGLRIPNSPPILRLVKNLASPLITTSVNMHGDPPARTPSEIIEFFRHRNMADDLVLLVDNGPLPPSKGSTVVDLSGDRISIVRVGDDYETISSFLRKAIPQWQP
jgi:tRNA threonylcarbamoyl adenosine modification protein (Sua5/YciO/YrdC/YwlC family)